MTLNGSLVRTTPFMNARTAHPAKAETTKSALLKSVPYHFGSPRRSRGSNVPIKATQQTPNGFEMPGSNIAASSGAVVIVAWTPPGSRTGKAAATNVTKIQKKTRPRSKSSGGGAETRTRMSPASETTGKKSSRSDAGTGASQEVTSGRICEGARASRIEGDTYDKQKKGPTALPLRAFTRL